MTAELGTILLVVSLLGLLAGVVVWAYVARFTSPAGATVRVTDLGRSGVIDQGRLGQAYSRLAGNPQRDLGRWIARDGQRAAVAAAVLGMSVTAVNVLVVLGNWCGFRNVRPPAPDSG